MAFEDYIQTFGSDLPPAPTQSGSIPRHVLDALAFFGYPVNALAGLTQGLISEDPNESALSNAYQGITGKRAFHFGDIMGIPRPNDDAPWSEYLPQLVAHELPQFMLDPLNVVAAPAKAAGLFPRVAKAAFPFLKEGQSLAGKGAELAGANVAKEYLASGPLGKAFMRRAPESIPGAKGFEEAADRIGYEHDIAPIQKQWVEADAALTGAMKDYPGVTKADVYDALEREGSRPDLQPLVDIARPIQQIQRDFYEKLQQTRDAVGRESYPALEIPGEYNYMKHMEIPTPGKGGARGQLGDPNAYKEPGRTIWRYEDATGKVIAVGKDKDPRTGIVQIPTSGEPETWFVGKDNIKKGRSGLRVKQFAESDPNRQGLKFTDPDTGKVVALGDVGTAKAGVVAVKKATGQVDANGKMIFETEHWLVGPDNVRKGIIKVTPESPGYTWADQSGKVYATGPATPETGIATMRKATGQLDDKGNMIYETVYNYAPGNVDKAGHVRVWPKEGVHDWIDRETGKIVASGPLGKNATGVTAMETSEGPRFMYSGENIKGGKEIPVWPRQGQYEFFDDALNKVIKTGEIGENGIIKLGNEYFDIGTPAERAFRRITPMGKASGETKNFVPEESMVPVQARPLPLDVMPGMEVTASPHPIVEPGVTVKPTPNPITEIGTKVVGTPQEPVMPGFQVFKKPASLKEVQAVAPNRTWLDDPMAAMLLEITRRNEQTKYIKMLQAGIDSGLVEPGLTARAGFRPLAVKGFEDFQAHPAIANRLENMGKGVFDPESGAGSIAQLLDNVVNSRAGQALQKGTNFWRRLVLGHAGWLSGNLGSNPFQQFMEMNPLMWPYRTAEAIGQQVKGGPRYEEWLARGLEESGQYGGVGSIGQQVQERLGMAMGKEPPGMLGKATGALGKVFLDPIFKVGSKAEGNAKIAVANDWIAKNAPNLKELPIEEQKLMLNRAARVAHEALGNYSRQAMTPTEANLAALPIPFYGWLSHVARSTWKNATQQPQKLNRLGMTLDTAFEPISQSDKDIADPWIKEQSPVRKFLGMDFGTSSTGLPNIAMLGRYLPQGNLEQFLKRPTDAALSWVNPFIKGPAELGANRSAFKGREIDAVAGGFPQNLINPIRSLIPGQERPYEMATNKLFGQSVPAGWDYMLGQSPWGRHLKETDVMGEGLGLWRDPNREPSSPWEAGAYTVSGGKFYPFDRSRYEKSRKWEASQIDRRLAADIKYAQKRGDTVNEERYRKMREQERSRRAGMVEN
ncbi:MAG: hypothetical protein WC891_08910 [Actinomycetota bacterium]